MDRHVTSAGQTEECPAQGPEHQYSPSSYTLGIPAFAPPNYYVTSPTKKFDPTKIPSKIYTEYAKPVYLSEPPRHSSEHSPSPRNSTGLNTSSERDVSKGSGGKYIVPSNIQSYLESNEPIYQNENPRKGYESMTHQKFSKPNSVSTKPPESVKSPYTPKATKSSESSLPVPSSPDVKEEKKKKWTLGGLFRRRKKDSDTESSSQEEEPRKGFLARRRSRREKRKQRANKSTAGFDHIVKPPDKRDASKDPARPGLSPENTMSADSLTKSPGTEALRVKGLSRDSLVGSHDHLSSRSSRHQDSSLSRNSSGGSGSLEGLSRRERLGVIKARAEALRQKGSSSDEDPNSVANSLHRSGSVNRRSRFARTERYIKRLSRDEESILHREAIEKQRLCKSDAEGPFAVTNRWLPAGQEGSDCDPRYNVTSATPSPGQSPLVRHKNVHYSTSAPLASVSNPASLDRKSYQSQSVRGSKCYSVRGHSPLPPTCDPKLPQRHPTYDNFQYPGQRSLSYDNNIHRVSNLGTPPATENVMVVQFPLGRISQFQPRGADPSVRNSVFVAVKPGPPPPPPRDPQRLVTTSNCLLPENARSMSYAFEDGTQGLHPGFGTSHQKQHGSFISLNNQPGAVPMTAGARSNSENQIMGQTNSFPRPQARPRPSSVTPEAMKPLPGGRYNIVDTPFKSQFQYYADQTPRSRKPIHIQYHPDQPYLSDSQVVLMKPPQPRNHPVSQVTEFWRQKEQDNNANNMKARRNSGVRLPRSDRSRSPSPHLKESQESPRFKHRCLIPIRPTESLSSLSGHSDVSSPIKASDVHDSHESLGGPHNSDSLRRKDQQRPLSMVLESQEQMSLPPIDTLSHPDVTPKMRFLQDVLPNKGAMHGGMTKLRPVQDNTPSTRAAMDGLPRTRSNAQESVATKTRVAPKLFSRSISAQDTKPEPSQESLIPKNKPVESSIPKFMTPVQDYSSNSSKIKSTLSDSSPKIQAFIQETQSALLSSKNAPPTPPVRRFSRQLSNSSMEAVEMAEIDLEPRARKSSNLEDALDELEAIYQSLKLGDEDLLDRAERRDLPTQFQRRDSIQDSFRGGLTRGSMSDSGYNYEMPIMEVRKRAPPNRRSGVPDKVTDDMAYRRLHPKDRPNSQNIISQAGSFILASPVLSQASSMNQGLDQAHLKTANQEPDTTFDDVVYRNIRHVNNSLKCLDPQPLFGIPLGPVTPAPDSDYLHAKPSMRYRPTFKPRRTPDVVADDLAYRNLRKDSPKDTALPTAEDAALTTARQLKDNNFSLRRRRAVRSLSANLPSLIGRDNLTIINVNMSDRDFEKAQSLTHLPDALEIAQKILEGKEVIGGGPSLLTHAQLDACRRGERVNNADRNSLCTTSTSTETLTDSRANLTLFQDSVNKRNSWQQKLRVNIPTNEPNLQRPPPPSTPERRNMDESLLPPSSASSLNRLSLSEKGGLVHDASSTSVVNGSLPVPDALPGSPLDEAQLEDLLSALAREARVTSKQLGIQLAGLKKPSPTAIHHVHRDVSLEGGGDAGDASVNNASAENIDETKFVIETLHIYEPNDMKEIDGPAKTEGATDAKRAETESEVSDALAHDANVNQKVNEIHFKLVNDEEEDIMPDSLMTWEDNNNNMTDDSLNVHCETEDIAETINKMLSKSRERNLELPDTFPLKQKTSNGTTPPSQTATTTPEDSGISSVKLEEVEENQVTVQHVTATQTGRTAEEEEDKEEGKNETRNGTGSSAIMSRSNGAAGKSDRLQYTSSEGETRTGRWLGREPTNVLMACSYCIACTQQMIGLDLDWLTILGIVLAIISIIAILMLF